MKHAMENSEGNGLSEIFGKERKLGGGKQGRLFCGEKISF